VYTSRRGFDDDVFFGRHLGREPAAVVEPRQDGAEDVLERLGVEVHDGKQVVVPLVPLRDGRAPAPGWAHRRREEAILHRPEGVIARVPPLVVHELPQQLDGGLRAVRFLLGHV
jgi:hypothetical protein